MDIFDALTLIGGLCLFLFGMNVMGDALERRAGGKLQALLAKLTTNKIVGFLTGLGVTAVIQSSSATTVMVVGFVNSGLMTLKQSINVIMGANVGTTVTAWLLSLGDISGTSLLFQLLKPTSFTPILALIGIAFTMFFKSNKKKDTGSILLGFAVLMCGMDMMSGAVSGLKDVPEFTAFFTMFENPILGMLAGAVLTAIIQSSSASVGILQALTVTGAVSYGAAIPIVMGQRIGTCITAIISSFGANRNAKRAALIHLLFNVIGTAVWLSIFAIVDAMIVVPLLDAAADYMGIAIVHTAFSLIYTIMLMPVSSWLEKLAYIIIPDREQPEKITVLDERLITTPAIAIEQCRLQAVEMAEIAVNAMKNSLGSFGNYDEAVAKSIREAEDETDKYEDVIGTFLVKLSANQTSDHDSAQSAQILKVIGDLERISDYAVSVLASAEEMRNKQLEFSETANAELKNLCSAINEILDLTLKAFVDGDMTAAATVEPLEQIVDKLKTMMRNGHIDRLQQGVCSIGTGFVWSDILTALARTSDHCSNIAGSVIDAENENLNIHESLRAAKNDSEYFKEKYQAFADKYLVVESK